MKIYYYDLLDTNKTIAKDLFEGVECPWEVLPNIKEFILKLGQTLDKDKFYKIDDDIWIAKSAVIDKSASLTGPLIIDENAQIRQCAFIRGSVIIGKNAVVGNSSEIKNSVLFDEVQTPHYNYIGDSILGYKAHFGAGSVTSNLKADKSLVKILCNGYVIHTELRKFGAIVGDFGEIGCNAVLNPGTVIGRNSNVYPLSMVRGYLESDSIHKNNGIIVKKIK
ncbi:MAG: UDP-N-acetylglucosamine pyrophosphorylase [Clostridia bacterium]|nr:UDP-N-acetylglucosamine pyrophosphorylase [Clostridia bacterium]